MEEQVFWSLLERVCRMGKFVTAVPNSAASANIVGEMDPGFDGGERVLQKKGEPSSHVHFKIGKISEFAFTFVDAGYGPEPCLELRTKDGVPALRLYYQGGEAGKRFEEFLEQNVERLAWISGSWVSSGAAQNQGILV